MAPGNSTSNSSPDSYDEQSAGDHSLDFANPVVLSALQLHEASMQLSSTDDDGVGDGVAEGEGDDDEHVYLFIPPGWFHWLLADSAWHVAWSGSYFPRAAAAASSPTGTTSTSTGGRRARNPRRS